MTTIDDDQVFKFIVDYKREHDGLAPTVREIMRGVGVGSTSVVVYHLERLEGQGRIRLLGWGRSRGIMVVGGRWEYPPRRR